MPGNYPKRNKLHLEHGKSLKTRMLIDVAISGDRNVIKEEAEKILKYKDLLTEIQGMWNVEANVIPVTIGVTGTISKSLGQYLSNIPGKRTKLKTTKNSHIGQCTLWKVPT